MSTETTSDKYHIKKLDNEGHNYSVWVIRCQTVLKALDIWSVVDPELTLPIPTIPPSSSTSGKSPTAEPSDPADAEWHKKNKKACTVILLSIEDTPIQIVKEKCLAKDIWKKLTECSTGIGAHNASILMSYLHRFQLDDSKPLEIQLNQMCKKIDHTIEKCWAEGGSSEGQHPEKTQVHSLDQDKLGKILRRRTARLTSSLLKSMPLLPNPIAFTQQNGLSILELLLTPVLIDHGSAPIHSLILPVPFTLVTNKLFMPLVRAKLRSKFILVLITNAPSSKMSSTVLK